MFANRYRVVYVTPEFVDCKFISFFINRLEVGILKGDRGIGGLCPDRKKKGNLGYLSKRCQGY